MSFTGPIERPTIKKLHKNCPKVSDTAVTDRVQENYNFVGKILLITNLF
jgi:hypothetical protein